MDKKKTYVKNVAVTNYAVGVVIIALCALAIMWVVSWYDVNQKTIQAEREWLVSTQPIQRADYAPELILYGHTESPEHTSLAASLSADVKRILVSEGEPIKKNQRLLVLDQQEIKLALRQQQAELLDIISQIKAEHRRHQADQEAYQHELSLLAIAERGYQRQSKLVNKQVGTANNLDAAKRDMIQQQLMTIARKYTIDNHQNRISQLNARKQQTEAKIERSQLDLLRTQVKSPYRGKITKILTATGNRVQMGEPLIELFSTECIEIRAQIPTQYLSVIRQSLAKGKRLSAQATVENIPIQLYLDRLASKIDRGRGGIDGLFKFNDIRHPPTLGRTISLKLKLPKYKNIFRVPYAAVYHDERVYRVDQQRLTAIPIQRLGVVHQQDKPSYMLIDSPQLHPGDRIVVTPIPNIRSGMKVKIRD